MLDWLEQTDYSAIIRESSWGWPLALTVHAFGMAVVVSIMFIMTLRLFGRFRTIPYGWLGKLIPLVWIGVACQIVSGASLLMAKPKQYLGDTVFESKLALLAGALAVTWTFHATLKREVAGWDATGSVSTRGLQLVCAAALLWAAVTLTGRLTAYLGSLYL